MAHPAEWKSTSCILCSTNCGLQVQVEDGHFKKIKGDKSNPRSKGYTCEKPSGLDHYQNHADRLTTPLRRSEDGSFEAIDWDTAIREVAGKLARIRDTHGGSKIFYYGGGGQGNHLGGVYSGATRRVLDMRYSSNALAQEKTGEFWVERQMFGGRPEPDFEHAQVAVFVGKNPWHSHGFDRARPILRAIAKDRNRHMIVVDPRRTESADLADIFLQVVPGTDAFVLAAMLKVLVEEGLTDLDFLSAHASDGQALFDVLSTVPVADYCERAGVSEELVRQAARLIGGAESVSVLEDLGVEMAPHSTLNSYLEKLLYSLTGHLARPGTMNLGTHIGKLIGGGKDNKTSPVGGHKIITGLIPCNAIPDEILSDHPDRFRAMFIESGNPVHSLADSPRMREALDALECVVVIDVAMTETAKRADYILPAASQYEKVETTFFGGGFPDHTFLLRQPLFPIAEGTLTEPEIHSRLCRALGAFEDRDLATLREAAQESVEKFGLAFVQAMTGEPKLAAIMPVVLYETLGRSLGEGLEGAASVWGAVQTLAMENADSVRRAGFEGEGLALGNALFRAILDNTNGVVITSDPYEATMERIRTDDGRIELVIPELIQELADLIDEQPPRTTDDYPFILAAGERRTSTANTIFRDPSWRRKDGEGAMRMSPGDAEGLGVETGDRIRLTTKRGSVEAIVEVNDTLREGHITIPNGYGLEYPDAEGTRKVHGIPPNELTSSEDRDWLALTPWHKHVRARVEVIA
ncbi:MAG: molybdopterin-dependent oxidoreductase [bacterium]|nr:molybdopterin oxidoreductase [Deltaproteobacteria bacterium]MCP4908463.1 molybdopterin-dependent oxidoreductase [bacterium]